MWPAEGVTVEPPESIVRRAEARASELGIPLSEFVTRAVEGELGQMPPRTATDLMAAGFGELRHLHEETVHINRIIEEEFEQIEPEDWT
jgi:hypothetical protein